MVAIFPHLIPRMSTWFSSYSSNLRRNTTLRGSMKTGEGAALLSGFLDPKEAGLRRKLSGLIQTEPRTISLAERRRCTFASDGRLRALAKRALSRSALDGRERTCLQVELCRPALPPQELRPSGGRRADVARLITDGRPAIDPPDGPCRACFASRPANTKRAACCQSFERAVGRAAASSASPSLAREHRTLDGAPAPSAHMRHAGRSMRRLTTG